MNTDNFFSVERLVEFGLGAGIAQQMVNSMNSTLKSAYRGSYGRVAAFARQWRAEQAGTAGKAAFVPLKFVLGVFGHPLQCARYK